MTKKLVFRALLVVMTALSLHDLVGMAQGVMTPPGTFIPWARWKKMLDDDKPELGIVAGQAARIVPPFVIRRRVDGPNNASVHTKEGDGADVTKMCLRTLEGSGTYTTGRSDARSQEPDGWDQGRGYERHQAGRRHRHSTGDGSLVQQD